MTLADGSAAPEFALPDQHGRTVRLAEFRGNQAVVLVFFPFAFSATCRSELGELQARRSEFGRAGAELVAVSVDSKYALRAWAEREGFEFPLLADFWPHGEVARAYGAFLDGAGHAARATFGIDRGGVIRSSFSSPPGVARPFAAYEATLATLASG
ncbi:peroxiredoxin [Agromyces sp. G08B096]|uniref:thioredoxin-dependent peroxiredoxin n=1 Tax=Agromyces sp. G08B096 TaxID=3156399 RepID=A0AAU7W1M3_9MICO